MIAIKPIKVNKNQIIKLKRASVSFLRLEIPLSEIVGFAEIGWFLVGWVLEEEYRFRTGTTLSAF
jgi:hypothetical protein